MVPSQVRLTSAVRCSPQAPHFEVVLVRRSRFGLDSRIPRRSPLFLVRHGEPVPRDFDSVDSASGDIVVVQAEWRMRRWNQSRPCKGNDDQGREAL